MIVLQLEFPAQLPCLLHIAMCSALCNESTLQYNPDKGNYEKIGESTEVALRVLAEKVSLILSTFDNYCGSAFLLVSNILVFILHCKEISCFLLLLLCIRLVFLVLILCLQL